MANPFSNNTESGDWPDLPAEDYAQIMETVQGVQDMKDHQDDGPLPGTTS